MSPGSGTGWSPASGAASSPISATVNTDVEAWLFPMNEAFVARLEELAIPATVDVSPGTHTWPYWEHGLHQAMPMLLEALGLGGETPRPTHRRRRSRSGEARPAEVTVPSLQLVDSSRGEQERWRAAAAVRGVTGSSPRPIDRGVPHSDDRG
jgi:hypothetical protein